MPINPLNINTAHGGSGDDFQAQGDRTIARQLGSGFKVKQQKGMSLPVSTPLAPATPAAVINFPAPSTGTVIPSIPPPSGGAPTIGGAQGITPGAAVGEVLATAANLAREDDFNPYVAPGNVSTAIEAAPPRPGVIVMPEHFIFGDATPDPVVGSGAAAGAPPPPPPAYTPPPLVQAPPSKKSSPWLIVAALIAAALALS